MVGLSMSEESESLLQFPCDFSIKAMGKAEPDFDLLVYKLVRRHAPDIHEGAVRSRPSKGGKWVSVTVTVRAQSKQQLDAIYMDLTAHKKIVMAL
jgi:putative lipoic acid-binding regulatory protein